MLSDSTSPEELWQAIPEATTVSGENCWRSLALMVQSLPLEQRQVIELAYFQGMSQFEIEEVLSWLIGSVKTRMWAAMVQLRADWEEF